VLTDEAGAVAENASSEDQVFAYDAYGNMLSSFSGAVLTDLLYAGEQRDADSGLYYLRARYYDPSTGRFTALDPAAGSPQDPISLHKYLYAGANPVMFADPTGMFFGGIVDFLATFSIQMQIRAMEFAPKAAAYTWAVTKIAGIMYLGSSAYRWLEIEGWVPETGFTQHIQTASGAIFLAGFVLTGALQAVPAPRGRIPYGSSYMSRQGIVAREAAGKTSGGNVAAFEYTASDGSTKTIVRFAERFGGGHAERIIANDLQQMGISPSQVTRIYSELQPCSVPANLSCEQMIRREFPQASVCWSFDYGPDTQSRARGVEELKAALQALFGG
jgi:RHS repeat-associated protein